VQVLLNRVDRLGWQALAHETAPTVHELLGERLSAVVVDPEILDEDIFGFVEHVGKLAPELALVVVSQQASVRDRVRGLHLGADDWIMKPCHPDEVAARIEAILRRARRATSRLMTTPSVSGELEIDLSRFQVYVGDQSLDFTRREFEVLRLLAGAVGKVLTREEIYEQVWGYRMAHGDRSVDVFVRSGRTSTRTSGSGIGSSLRSGSSDELHRLRRRAGRGAAVRGSALSCSNHPYGGQSRTATQIRLARRQASDRPSGICHPSADAVQPVGWLYAV
jgi:DNA-binding response OmpR family regulator